MKSTLSTIRVGTLDELAQKKQMVVKGQDRPIVVFYNDGDVCAVDNRCPHMGFPLHKGECTNGFIVCPWHHARFEAHSGSTFDLFADDVEPFDVTVEGEEVFVATTPRARDVRAQAQRRLREGMETNNALVIAKAIMTLRSAGVQSVDIVRTATLFGVSHGDEWRSGLTSLSALSNLLPYLNEETAYLALYQGIRRVAAESAGQPSRRNRYALETDQVPAEKLAEWFSSWTRVRHRDAAERTLLTAIENGHPRETLISLIINGGAERVYANTGHVVDFSNKSFEMLDLIGWEHAKEVLPSLTVSIVQARGAEEQNSWRQPLDLIPMLQSLSEELPGLLEQGTGKAWAGEAALADEILADDPRAILQSYRAAIIDGATPSQLAKATTFAAALRLARFGASNEIADWVTALHTFSYCHAVHQILKVTSQPKLISAVLHGGLSVYQDRFLNVPPLRLPQSSAALPTTVEELQQLFLETLDRSTQNHEAAVLVAHYLDLGHPIEPLIETFTYAIVREDADFHGIQMVEAAVREYLEWNGGSQGRTLMVAVARYLAAFAPTQRAQLQTARIAWRLHRGENLYEDEIAEA